MFKLRRLNDKDDSAPVYYHRLVKATKENNPPCNMRLCSEARIRSCEYESSSIRHFRYSHMPGEESSACSALKSPSHDTKYIPWSTSTMSMSRIPSRKYRQASHIHSPTRSIVIRVMLSFLKAVSHSFFAYPTQRPASSWLPLAPSHPSAQTSRAGRPLPPQRSRPDHSSTS